jgi:hypothetical protein
MTKAGEKLIAAMKEAVKSYKCRHKWERTRTTVRNGMIVAQYDECPKCGTKRSILDAGAGGER